jgi:hypothetical protein
MQGGWAMHATAYVVGPLDGSGAALMDFALLLDFAAVLPFGDLREVEERTQTTPICFFLFSAVPDVAALRDVAEAVRFSPSRRLRFSPLVYFSPSPSADGIGRCINMGFDDIITMPFNHARVKERLDRQIGRSLVFYETAGYFGPDRRKSVSTTTQATENRKGGQFRRLEIVRRYETGVSLVRDDFYAAPAG